MLPFTRLPAIINPVNLLPRINRSKTNNFTIQFSIMKEFALLFRQPDYDYSDVSPKDFEAITRKWQDWINNLKSTERLVNNGTRLTQEGKVLRAGGVITDGPFVEIRERLGSFLVVKAESLEEATTLAHGCPALDAGGSVEIRPIFQY
jgi:hypothetical protein